MDTLRLHGGTQAILIGVQVGSCLATHADCAVGGFDSAIDNGLAIDCSAFAGRRSRYTSHVPSSQVYHTGWTRGVPSGSVTARCYRRGDARNWSTANRDAGGSFIAETMRIGLHFGQAVPAMRPPFCKGENRGETMANKVPCFRTRCTHDPRRRDHGIIWYDL